jgi:hypothetical protein
MTCPICTQEYFAIAKSENVCKRHDGWFVTRCVNCQRISFSQSVGMCEECYPVEETPIVATYSGNKSRRKG